MGLTIWSLFLLVYFVVAIVGVLLLAYFAVAGMALSGAVGILSGEADQKRSADEEALANVPGGAISRPPLTKPPRWGEPKPVSVTNREAGKDEAVKDHARV